MSTNRAAHSDAALICLVALVVAGCGGAPPALSGQAAEPIALSSATSGAGGVGGDVLAELVEQSTDEAVRIKSPTIEPQGDDAEGDIIDALATGAADVSVVRADRLATAGAASLSVLQIPLLVTNLELADKIAADPLAEDLMADLDRMLRTRYLMMGSILAAIGGFGRGGADTAERQRMVATQWRRGTGTIEFISGGIESDSPGSLSSSAALSSSRRTP